MIAGRPTNLWLGFTTSLVGLAAILALAAGVSPELVAQLGAGVTAVLGAAIALVAYQPPTLGPGDTYRSLTPAGVPNGVKIVHPNGDATDVSGLPPSPPSP